MNKEVSAKVNPLKLLDGFGALANLSLFSAYFFLSSFLSLLSLSSLFSSVLFSPLSLLSVVSVFYSSFGGYSSTSFVSSVVFSSFYSSTGF